MISLSPELQIALVTYVVPGLVMAWVEVRRRRLTQKTTERGLEQEVRRSDWEIGQELRDEIRRVNQALRDENDLLRARVKRLEQRVGILTELATRHGLPIPDWKHGT